MSTGSYSLTRVGEGEPGGLFCCAELIAEDEAGKQKPPSLGLWQLGCLQSLERKRRLSG